ncbi:hypothetical protein N7468_005878 [Penicillium chermesinum]|uniref:Uncharacterized protein n=1 Tax=Penicillium chermesinum TaxID=63820 RepID=A0A9W9P053_9EURO|nr:uncharacterized protein N7468_005878 [Penicillium chermesinum]KAJ5232922.1 hypothetical protein N7468_005878 [Penicillium chermesinum]
MSSPFLCSLAPKRIMEFERNSKHDTSRWILEYLLCSRLDTLYWEPPHRICLTARTNSQKPCVCGSGRGTDTQRPQKCAPRATQHVGSKRERTKHLPISRCTVDLGRAKGK